MATYTPMQAAALLGCSLSTVYRRVRRGGLARGRATGGGDALRVDDDHVRELLTVRSDAERYSVDVATAARQVGVSHATLCHLVYSGRLSRYPMPYREMRIWKWSLERYLSARDALPDPP